MDKQKNDFHEIERLRLLNEFQVLDTEREQVYDDITLLASQIFQTPIALVSLIDHDRQWFKSRYGLSVEETPRRLSFCQYTIQQADVLVIEDAKQDSRFDTNEYVHGPMSFRFYAAAPLMVDEKYALGTVCVLDTKPRGISSEQRDALMALARQVMGQLQLRIRNRQLQSQMDEQKIQAELIQNQQEQLVEAARKTTIGMIAAGMAHQINNPLMIIQGKALQLRRLVNKLSLDQAAEIGRNLESIELAIPRISGIVKGLLSIARDEDDPDPRLLTLNEWLKEALNFWEERMLSRQIVLDIQLNGLESCQIESKGAQLTQALIKVLHNAFDAVSDYPERRIWIKAKRDESQFLVLEICDSGPGVRPEILARIGEPFLTTKPAGQGAGLGLVIIKSIVEAHNGEFLFNSKKGLSCFSLRLPIQKQTTSFPC